MSSFIKDPKIFSKAVKVSGNLCSAFCFETQEDVDAWLMGGFKALKKEYGELTFTVSDLSKLKIGDTCAVIGE